MRVAKRSDKKGGRNREKKEDSTGDKIIKERHVTKESQPPISKIKKGSHNNKKKAVKLMICKG